MNVILYLDRHQIQRHLSSSSLDLVRNGFYRILLAAAPGAGSRPCCRVHGVISSISRSHSQLFTSQRILLLFLYIFALLYFPIGSRDVS